MHEPPSGSMQLQKLQFNFKVYLMETLNTRIDIRVFPRLSDYFSTLGMQAGFIKAMQAEEMQNYKNISIFCRVKPKKWREKKQHFTESLIDCI